MVFAGPHGGRQSTHLSKAPALVKDWEEDHSTEIANKAIRDTDARNQKKCLGCTPRGSCNNTLLRRLLRRFFTSRCFLEGFLEGTCKGFQ